MSHEHPDSVSRRGFLKGVGATAAAGAFLSGVAGAGEGDEAAKVVGPGAVKVQLEVDGKKRDLVCEPRRTLLDALRDDLGVTAPKRVCDRGACGACTVLVDGVPRLSCMNLAIEASGKKVVTAAGLGAPQNLHPVQQAFWDHDAQQCGFCTPGFVVSIAALLQANPRPTEEEIQRAASGNLCRCGTYTRVLEATRKLARQGEER